MISWNVNFKCVKSAGRVCRAIRNLGVDICGLQEVAKWGKLSGFVYSQLVLYTKSTSDCGFLVSRRLMPAVRESVFGQFWAGLVIGRVILINVHLHHEDRRGEEVCHEVQQFVRHTRQSRVDADFHVILIGDFNVELPANVCGVTGCCALHGKRRKTEHSTLAWLRDLEVRALNTYPHMSVQEDRKEKIGERAGGAILEEGGEKICERAGGGIHGEGETKIRERAGGGILEDGGDSSSMNKDSNMADMKAREGDELWTWGRRRKRARKTQIDYVCVSGGITGTAAPLRQTVGILFKSDHVPVMASIRVPTPIQCARQKDFPKTTTGWGPIDEAAKHFFINEACNLALDSPPLNELEDKVKENYGKVEEINEKPKAKS